MRAKKRSNILAGLIFLLGVYAAPLLLSAQTKVKPGFNLFSVEQDVEIGRESAVQVERQLPILKNRRTKRYISDIGRRLAAVAPGPDFPYQFKVLNISDINAFALPGGFMYINRGLIEAAENEAQLAGVMAHEMAHVALRHGTNQVSKAYLTQAGLGVLGALLGGGGATRDIIDTVGGFGLNAVFLKFSRSAEKQADIVGAQMLVKAGYDPMAMAKFFEILAEHSDRDPSKLEQFFSSHPPPADRSRRVQEEARLLGPVRQVPSVGGFEKVKSDLRRMPAAPSMKQLAQAQSPRQGSQRGSRGRGVNLGIEPPSSRLKTFKQSDGLFRIRYPENWLPFEAARGSAVTIVPRGGVVDLGKGEESVIYGVIVNHYDRSEDAARERHGKSRGPFPGRTALERASNDIVNQILQANSYLRPVSNSDRKRFIDGERALSVVLSGESSVTRQEEQVTLLTRLLPDGHAIYLLLIAPASEYEELSRVFDRMISSLKVFSLSR
ncbi:M48 family metallopeptidase [Acidobacteria bacterium AH-259-O06]|nr:M48 family metallopeptidase [Acidobacteria bacterium AH-259-O06]